MMVGVTLRWDGFVAVVGTIIFVVFVLAIAAVVIATILGAIGALWEWVARKVHGGAK